MPPYTVVVVRIVRWSLLVFALASVQIPMAWCEQSGLHPEIPAPHDHHNHDHERPNVHPSVELEFVVPSGAQPSFLALSFGALAALVEAVASPIPVLRSSAADGRALVLVPPGSARLTTVQLL